jgi:hypothetical protein
MAVKKFKGYVSDEPIVIELEKPESSESVRFKCRRAVAGSRILDFLKDTSEDDPSSMARAVFGLLESALETSELEGFREFVDDPENGITLETLSEIAGWVAEQFSGRPTEPQLQSMAG